MVSIITINLNHAEGLRKTLASVAMQQAVDYEHIIIDGGSRDHSLQVIAAFSHVAKFISEPDTGIYHAQNKGWKMATGQYCLFLNSGDRLCEPHTIGLLAAKASPRTIVYGNKYVEQPDGSLVLKEYPDTLNASFFNYDTPPHCCTLIPKIMLKARRGYDERLKICADWKFFRHVHAANMASFVHVPEACGIFEGGGLSANDENRPTIMTERGMVKHEETAIGYRLQKKINRGLAPFGLWIPYR
jgi:glycosyltransferase involved in cell wall biosynthesis